MLCLTFRVISVPGVTIQVALSRTYICQSCFPRSIPQCIPMLLSGGVCNIQHILVADMASVLSLARSSPLQDFYTPHSHHGIGRSGSSVRTAGSTGTVQHHRLQSFSGSSLSSLTSLWTPAFRRQHDGTPSRSSSSQNLTLRRLSTASATGSYSRRASLVSVLSSRLRSEPVLGSELGEQRLDGVIESENELLDADEKECSFMEDGLSHHEVYEESTGNMVREKRIQDTTTDAPASSPTKPRLRRWLSTLRRRKRPEPLMTTPRSQRWRLDDFDSRPSSPIKPHLSNHRKSHSFGSSLGFVTAVRSATATLASVSIATMSRRNTKWHRGHQRSSLVSGSDVRQSIDSQRSVLDEAAKHRSRKRRAKVEELIRTEESYVADLKSLYNVISHHTNVARRLLTRTGLLHDTRTRPFFSKLRKIFCSKNHIRDALPPRLAVSPASPHCTICGTRSTSSKASQ